MKAIYSMTLNINVIADVDTLEGLKSDREYAEDLLQMVCDEATQTNSVAVGDIVKSAMIVN